MAVAHELARAGWRDVTIVERGDELGGLAGTFEQGGHFYPLAYHHILRRDRTLLRFLDEIGALGRVKWRNTRMLFHLDGGLYDLANPLDFMRLPMNPLDKLRFVRLMLRSFRKSDWRDWIDSSAEELVDTWGSPGVRRKLFEPLTRLKFDRECSEVSGAWLGARLHFREGSSPLGYIPGCNWTKVLCDGLTDLLREQGVRVRLSTNALKLHGFHGRVTDVELDDGDRLRADLVVSTVPTEVYRRLIIDETPQLNEIRYTAVVSAICATRQTIDRDFYWMNLASLDSNACGIFLLNSLNPTIGAPGDNCVNFVTHLPSRDHDFFRRSDQELMAGYADDFQRLFGRDLDPFWTKISRVPMYSPVFARGFRNPPVQSATWRNVFFAGNYRSFPSVASTGTAMQSGVETGRAVLENHDRRVDLPVPVQVSGLKSLSHG